MPGYHMKMGIMGRYSWENGQNAGPMGLHVAHKYQGKLLTTGSYVIESVRAHTLGGMIVYSTLAHRNMLTFGAMSLTEDIIY